MESVRSYAFWCWDYAGVFCAIVFVLQAVESAPMTSLYDLLGAREDDDAHAIRKAFRNAVKAHHPDLHPGDPDAVLRFRRIITASAVLRDARQRAAYDQMLEFERQQIKRRLDHQHLQLQYQRRQIWWKRIGATAAVAVIGGLMCAYGLFMPLQTTAIVAVIKDQPAAATVPAAMTATKTATIVETIKKDKVPASAAPARETETAATPQTSGVQVKAREVRAHEESAHDVTARGMAHAGGAGPGIAEDALKPGAVPDTEASKGERAVVADRGEPTPAALPVAAPHGVKFYRELGISSYRAGDFPRAIVNLDVALRLDANDAQAYNIRGNAWDEIGVFDNALADYDEAIRIDPNNPIFFHDRAVLWHRKGNLDKTLVDLDRAIRFSFADPNLYCDRGLVWYEKGSQARAIADFDRAIKLDPTFAAAYINRGLILHRNSEYTVAFADLGKTIHVNPSVFDVSRKLK
jgi:tetratricopeptide (TPR) repeat protein